MRGHEHEHNTRTHAHTHAHTHEEAFYKSAAEVTLLTSILLCGRTIRLPITKGEITDQDVHIFILQDFINSRYHKHMEKKNSKDTQGMLMGVILLLDCQKGYLHINRSGKTLSTKLFIF